MKTYLRKMTGILAITLVSGLTLVSCDDDDVVTPPPAPKNIVETVVASADFSALEAAVLKAGLATALAGPNLTVFAPDNAAFAKLPAPFNNEANINAISDQATITALADILKYHVLTSVVNSGMVPAGPNAAVSTFLSNQNVFATRSAAGVFINGTQVTQADITATNGVIHRIGTVLMPASRNIVEIAVATPAYARLAQAVVKCNLQSALSAAGPLTVFAPNNAAFVAAGFDSTAIANANAATVSTLTNVLKLHVFSGRAFSSDITNGGTIPTLFTGNSLTTAITGSSVTIKGTGNGTMPANITGVNLLATNGVIHFIDKVLLP
jgi:uncharacterized surface protein with fasciclin (FAS1) repeats